MRRFQVSLIRLSIKLSFSPLLSPTLFIINMTTVSDKPYQILLKFFFHLLCLNLSPPPFFPSFFHCESPRGCDVLYQPAVDIWFDTLGQSSRTSSCPQRGSRWWYSDASQSFKVSLYVVHKQPPHFPPLLPSLLPFNCLVPFLFSKKNEAKIALVTLRL